MSYAGVVRRARTCTMISRLVALVLLAVAPLSGGGDSTLSKRTLDEWRALIEPNPAELAFTEIPWRPNLWSAVQEAQASDRPVLLWAMNGHPLGCT